MVRRGRAHLQKQGGMLASLGEDHVPDRKENLHSNQQLASQKHKPTEHHKQAQTKIMQVQPKLSQRQLPQPVTSPPKPKGSETRDDKIHSPIITTPPAPLSSIKINLPDESSSNETLRKELFHSPPSFVSSPPITKNSIHNSNEDSANESRAPSTVSSSYNTRTSTDSRSVVSQEDDEYSEALSSQIDDESNESLNSAESRSCRDESNSVVSEDNLANSCEESIPQYDYEEDEEYSIEVEESEDEFEFDEESEDGMVKTRKGRNKSGARDEKSALIEKKSKPSKNTVASSRDKSKIIKSKAASRKSVDSSTESEAKYDHAKPDSIDEEALEEAETNAEDESIESEENSSNEGEVSVDDREISCDFEAETAPYKSPQQTDVNERPTEMSSYISTLQHTQIKSSKSSFKRITKVASIKEPPQLQILTVVDELFQMIDDINTVTVSDIVHSVAEHFGLSKVKKETKKAIKARLTDLIVAKANGVQASELKSSDEVTEDSSKSKKRAGAKRGKRKDQAECAVPICPSEPSHSDIITLVDQLFDAADSDTVFFSDIVSSVATHFGIKKVKKETKRLIRARFVELMSSNEKNAESDAEQEYANQVPMTDDLVFKEPGSGHKVDQDRNLETERLSSGSEKENKDLSATENCDESQLSFGGVDASFDVDISDDESVEPAKEFISSNEKSTSSPVSSSIRNLKSDGQPLVKAHSNGEPSSSNECNGNKHGIRSKVIHPNTPLNQKSTDNLDSLVTSIDSREKSLAGEFLKCNESFMSCETTLFKNLSPECLKSNTDESVDNLMGSLSITDSLGSTNESKRVEKGKWNLGKEIGSGSFGVVHVGMNANDGSKYRINYFLTPVLPNLNSLFLLPGLMAVKVLRIPSKNKSAIVQELQREIDLMRSLNHPNIVRYMGAEVDTQNNILNIFQEWVPGGSVSSLLKQLGPFSIAVVRSYTMQILNGLEYLHSHHIIHRDIKVHYLHHLSISVSTARRLTPIYSI